jgi:hypothetical protein
VILQLITVKFNNAQTMMNVGLSFVTQVVNAFSVLQIPNVNKHKGKTGIATKILVNAL